MIPILIDMAERSPALTFQHPDYPERFGGRIPRAIRMLRRAGMGKAIALGGADYWAWVDSDGSVSAIAPPGLDDGNNCKIPLQPEDFAVLAYHDPVACSLKDLLHLYLNHFPDRAAAVSAAPSEIFPCKFKLQVSEQPAPIDIESALRKVSPRGFTPYWQFEPLATFFERRTFRRRFGLSKLKLAGYGQRYLEEQVQEVKDNMKSLLAKRSQQVLTTGFCVERSQVPGAIVIHVQMEAFLGTL
ncbi:MAG: hypothetical protein AAFY26_02030 [Cyanobacteria bacterium J06638_22]